MSSEKTPMEAWRFRLGRCLWLAFFLAIGLAALAWWRLMPGGFPLSHPRLWVNRVLPALVLTLAAAGLFAVVGNRRDLLRALLLAHATAWTAGMGLAIACFPISAQRFGGPAFLVALLFGVALVCGCGGPRRWRRIDLVPILLAAIVGGSVPFSQRADAPSTRPIDVPMPALVHSGTAIPSEVKTIRLGHGLTIRPADAQVRVSLGGHVIAIEPLLSFYQRSPDGFWISMTPRRFRLRSTPGFERGRRTARGAELSFSPSHARDAPERHHLRAETASNGVIIESVTKLEQPVFSHVNSYAYVVISAARNLELSFSPCPDRRCRFEAADYPVGRPLSFAYLDVGSRFRIVRAESGEKGPFTPLADGQLARDAPLVLTLFDQGRPFARLVFEDWARQLSTELSSTAGWGVPVNVVSFRLGANDQGIIVLSLADTGIGRGFDSVGHKSGTYRNRLRILSGA